MRSGDPQLTPARRLNVALAGNAPGLPPSISPFLSDAAGRLNWHLIGVASPDANAPGIREAGARSLFTCSDVKDLFSLNDLDLIIVSTKDRALCADIASKAPPSIGVMDMEAARRILDTAAEAGEDPAEPLLDRFRDPIFIVGPDRRILTSNRASAELFASTMESLEGLTCHQVLHGRVEACAPDECPLEGLSTLRDKTRFRDYSLFDGEIERHFEAAFRPLPGPLGEKSRYLISLRDVTARRNLEHALDRSRTRYKHLFDHAREGIALFDSSGRIEEANDSLRRMLGYALSEFLAMPVWNLAEKESREILSNHLDDLQILGSVTVEMAFLRKGGRPLPVETDVIWLPDEDLFLLMARDITARKRLEASRRLYSEKLEAEVAERTRELQQSQQETLRQKQTAEGIIRGTPLPMLVLDGDHRIIYWNRACENLTGFRSEEMIGTRRQWEPFYPELRPTLADLIIDDDEEAIRRIYGHVDLRRVPSIEGAWEGESFFPHIGEQGAHIFCTAAPIRGEEGEIRGAIVTYQDVTERAAMTRELERREAFVQNLIHNSIDGIIATDPKGTIIIFNRGVSKILGYDPEEILGRLSYQDILSRETLRDVLRAFYGKRFGPPGKVINMESALLNRHGEAIPVRLSGTLLHENGEEVGSVVFVQDLREILRLQQEKEQAERMAAVGKTVAGLAHYIKNILNGLKGGGYVINSAIRKGDLTLTGQGWAMVERNIDQIASIVMDMLTYSTEREPRYEPVDPNELVTEIMNLVEERSRLANVRLETELSPGLPAVSMDRTGIHRAILNLVTNAIDASTLEGIMEGRGKVVVRTDRPEGWGVRFEIQDNGTGMEEHTQEKLFSDFFTTKGYKGTGLGLPVTEKIVLEHNGKLTFETEPGKGTTFTLLLPDS